jgi:hypothetical protein
MGARRSPADQRSEIEMSLAKFLADIEVAVTGRDFLLPGKSHESATEVAHLDLLEACGL